MTYSRDQLEEIKRNLSGLSFTFFKSFLSERAVEKESEAQIFSENISTLLLREQAVGASREDRVLFEEFENHVNNKLKEAKDE